MTTDSIRIFPSVSELNKILNKIECPEKDCSEVFQNTPNLSLHLLKTHGRDKSLKSSGYGDKVAQYYCPEVGCKYCFNPDFGDEANSKFSNRFFTHFKYLKQHYIKVHLDKTFKCDKCSKAFPTESHRLRHYEVCGSKYTCSCGAVYSSLESLQTHARREKHVYHKNIKAKKNRERKWITGETTQIINMYNTQQIITEDLQNKNNNRSCCEILKLPTDSNILILHDIIALDDIVVTRKKLSGNTSVSTQTDLTTKRRKTQSPVRCSIEKPIKKRTSKQTQTGEKKPKKTTETQTVNLNLLSEDNKGSLKKCTSVVNIRKRKKSMETQTTNCSVSTDISSIESKTNDNSKIASTNNNYYNTYKSSNCVANNDEDSNSSDVIAKKDICLPQLWLNTESESVCKTDKDNAFQNYSRKLINIIENDKDVSTSCLNNNIEPQRLDFDDNNLAFYNRQNFCKEMMKGSNSLCHIETQTEFESGISSILGDYLNDLDNTILDQYTQTCDDIMLPDNIGLDLTNNETQTAWSLCDDSFISGVVNSETQTNAVLNIDDYST